MKVNMELDGEPISIEQSSPSDNSTGLNQREDFPYFNNSFNNADGMINHADSEGRITMVAAVAGQNTPNYFDQDNFYPADGMRAKLRKGSQQRKDNRKVKSDDRRNVRLGKKEAKTSEIQSRADLNREVGKDKQSDIELAKALQGGDAKSPMSTTTKVLIGVGVVAVIGAIAYFVIKKKK
jgi:hypothetical protein